MSKNAPLVALVGTPNSGKTALFNLLTGGKQKVGNYPGVTVERKSGQVKSSLGLLFNLLDLPGTYSFDAQSPDEEVTQKVVLGHHEGEPRPDLLIAVCDATSLKRTLGLILEVKELKIPTVVAVNMIDLADKSGLKIDLIKLAELLSLPVIATSALKKKGADELLDCVKKQLKNAVSPQNLQWKRPSVAELMERNHTVSNIVRKVILAKSSQQSWSQRIDRAALHMVLGPVILAMTLFLLFQAVFSLAELPMTWIESSISVLSHWISSALGQGVIRDLVVDGAIAGAGSVIVFLPQILILFFFINVLESSGYMMRATLLMNKLMNAVGLPGQAFVPLLSSFACAIPGIMATRTIKDPKDRLITMLIAPLMTCSARLPVYILLIGAFIPNERIGGLFNLQGIVMFGLFLTGIVFAMIVAYSSKILNPNTTRTPFIIDLPSYKFPDPRNLAIDLGTKAKDFLVRAGTVILFISVLLWGFASYPKPPADYPGSPMSYSYAGRVGIAMEPLFKPLGFDYRIVTGLISGFAAREVMVGVLGTTFAIEDSGGQKDQKGFVNLQHKLRESWSLATGLALLVWYIFSPQCLATLAVIRRETGSIKWPLVTFVYMLSLAYISALITYQIVTAFSGT